MNPREREDHGVKFSLGGTLVLVSPITFVCLTQGMDSDVRWMSLGDEILFDCLLACVCVCVINHVCRLWCMDCESW